MKLVYLHQSRDVTPLIDELFATRGTDFTIKVEFNRKHHAITSFEDTAGSWPYDLAKKIEEYEQSGRIQIIENSEPSEGTWKYYEVKHENDFHV